MSSIFNDYSVAWGLAIAGMGMGGLAVIVWGVDHVRRRLRRQEALDEE